MSSRSLGWTGALLLIPLFVIAVVAHDASETAPRGVPLAIVAPPVVADTVAAEANELPNRPFAALPVATEEEATRALLNADVRGVVVVDIAHTDDVLLIDGAADPTLNQAIAAQVRALASGRDRTVTERALRPDTDPDIATVRLVVLCCGWGGFALVVAISFWRGPFARTFRLGLARIAGVLAAAAAAGLAVALALRGDGGATDLAVVAVAAGAVLVTAALVTLALEALAGYAGLAVAAALFVGLSLPLTLRVDPLLLSRPWGDLVVHGPPGASLDAVAAAVLHGGNGLARPALVLTSWALVALAVLVLTRREAASGAPVPAFGTSPAPAPEQRLRRWRLHVLAAIAPGVLLLLVLQVALDRVGEDRLAAAVEPPSRATTTECVGTGEFRSVADLNRVTTQLRAGPEFQGADVGASVRLQDGRRLMMFGDTLRAARFDGQRFVRNSMLLVGDGCLQVVLPADGGALVPDRADPGSSAPVGYWPMSVAAESFPGYDLVAVMLQRVRTTGTTAFDFANLGPSVAVFVVAPGQTPQLLGVRDIGKDSPDAARPAWGAASAIDDGWLYLYGTAHEPAPLVFGFSLRVARVRPEEVLDTGAWRFWDGSTWVRRPGDAVELIGATGGTSQTLSVFERDGRWYALSKRDEFLGTDITVWSAPTPWGPYDAGQAVAPLPSDAATGQLRYMPLAHPDLLPEPGTVVVSYSRNREDVAEILEDPFRYRPRFLRVPLPAAPAPR